MGWRRVDDEGARRRWGLLDLSSCCSILYSNSSMRGGLYPMLYFLFYGGLAHIYWGSAYNLGPAQ